MAGEEKASESARAWAREVIGIRTGRRQELQFRARDTLLRRTNRLEANIPKIRDEKRGVKKKEKQKADLVEMAGSNGVRRTEGIELRGYGLRK